MNSFVGVDVHQDECHATVQNEEGEILKQDYFQNSPSGFEQFFEGIEKAEVAIEAGDAWQPVYDWLDENGFDVKLAHPNKVRIIAEVKIKTDVKDSKALADLLRADLIPKVYVPCEERRKLRRIIKRRSKLVQERSRYVNRIKSELRKRGIETDYDLRTKKAMSQLRDLEIDAVQDHLEVINALDGRISKLEDEIEEITEEMEETQTLMTIPGVSYHSALTIIAEIATVERFPSSDHLCSYARLVPSISQSGSKETHGSIQGGRPVLRWIMYQYAWNHVKNAPDSHITKFYEKLKERKPKQLAIIATARKLLKAIFWMLKKEEEFHPEGYDPRKSS